MGGKQKKKVKMTKIISHSLSLQHTGDNYRLRLHSDIKTSQDLIEQGLS